MKLKESKTITSQYFTAIALKEVRIRKVAAIRKKKRFWLSQYIGTVTVKKKAHIHKSLCHRKKKPVQLCNIGKVIKYMLWRSLTAALIIQNGIYTKHG